jgi:hypothetical protein
MLADHIEDEIFRWRFVSFSGRYASLASSGFLPPFGSPQDNTDAASPPADDQTLGFKSLAGIKKNFL